MGQTTVFGGGVEAFEWLIAVHSEQVSIGLGDQGRRPNMIVCKYNRTIITVVYDRSVNLSLTSIMQIRARTLSKRKKRGQRDDENTNSAFGPRKGNTCSEKGLSISRAYDRSNIHLKIVLRSDPS